MNGCPIVQVVKWFKIVKVILLVRNVRIYDWDHSQHGTSKNRWINASRQWSVLESNFIRMSTEKNNPILNIQMQIVKKHPSIYRPLYATSFFIISCCLRGYYIEENCSKLKFSLACHLDSAEEKQRKQVRRLDGGYFLLIWSVINFSVKTLTF